MPLKLKFLIIPNLNHMGIPSHADYQLGSYKFNQKLWGGASKYASRSPGDAAVR